ncbi:Multidrug transporter [Sphingomonas sp. EC-HK361]|uniref:SapC family protein n=1 Tax=Sphingomonas sp. EC-HK361 TaxID=2038397 RepID=UPI00125B5EAB|nr:SapC family protein [Sphingomonas sp. EC-HK361]VVS99092.1 Multidrug transporter [Sphingomonas sp. EC-HK361]
MTTHAILTAEAHRDLRVRQERGAHLGDALMCAVAMPAEFRQLQAEYAILFRLNPERDQFSAVAMFGFENGENLYLDGDRWDARYRPLAIDIQPFLIGGKPEEDGDKQVHVDMASPRIGGEEGVRVFDRQGLPTPYLERVAENLGALDAGFRDAPGFFTALERHALLEPFTLEVTLDDGSTNRLVGFHTINEDRLEQLDAQALGELHAAGHLMPIFMAVASLSNLSALIARKNRRMFGG